MQTAAKQIPYRLPIALSTPQNGLFFVCTTVGTERFSFYLLSSVLVLYLNEQIGFSSARSVQVFGFFLCAAYLAPFFGGFLCDGKVGCRRAALWGSVLQTAGYFALLSDRPVSLVVALGLLSVGSGLFKAGTQTLIAGLFAPNDPQRERGFSSLYVAINIGALVAPLLGAVLYQRGNWPGIFVLAAVGTLCSATLLTIGRPSLTPITHEAPSPHRNNGSKVSRSSYLRLGLLLTAGIVFTAGAVQSHSSLLLWARDRTDRQLGGFEIPVAWFAAAPAALVLLFTPLLASGFATLRRVDLEPTTFRKVVLGLLLSCMAAVPMLIASGVGEGGKRTSMLWVLACLSLLAVSELLVLALGPSELTRLAPATKQGRWLSAWFVAQAIGNLLGGSLHF